MTLDNKTAIINEYVTKRDAIRNITPAQVNTSLAGLDGFATQCDEAFAVLRAREDLLGSGATVSGATLTALAGKVNDVKSAAAGMRTLVSEIKALLPD